MPIPPLSDLSSAFPEPDRDARRPLAGLVHHLVFEDVEAAHARVVDLFAEIREAAYQKAPWCRPVTDATHAVIETALAEAIPLAIPLADPPPIPPLDIPPMPTPASPRLLSPDELEALLLARTARS